jgi:uncharacterized protein YycO
VVASSLSLGPELLRVEAGDILLVHGHSFWETAIELWCRSPYSHAAMAVPEKGHVVESKEFKGVQVVPASTYPHRQWFRVECSPQKRLQAAGWALSRLGQPYGWGDLPHDWDRPFTMALARRAGHLDCSMLVAWAYQRVGVTLTSRHYPTPADISRSPLLTRLEGT